MGAASISAASAPRPLSLQRVLVMAKQTRFELRAGSGPGLLQLEDDNDLQGAEKKRKKKFVQRLLSQRGLNYERLYESYLSHAQSLLKTTRELDVRGIDYDVSTASRGRDIDFPRPYKEYDAVFAAGGDGTFLKAASEIYTSAVPLIGINTDPESSRGALCSVQSADEFGNCLDRLLSGDFVYERRSRIRVSLSEMDASGIPQDSANLYGGRGKEVDSRSSFYRKVMGLRAREKGGRGGGAAKL